jgi:hypothetical protein
MRIFFIDMHGTPQLQLILRRRTDRQAEDFQTVARDVCFVPDKVHMIQEVVEVFSSQNASETSQIEELVRCVSYDFLRVLARNPDQEVFLVIKCYQTAEALYCTRDMYWFILASKELSSSIFSNNGMAAFSLNMLKASRHQILVPEGQVVLARRFLLGRRHEPLAAGRQRSWSDGTVQELISAPPVRIEAL